MTDIRVGQVYTSKTSHTLLFKIIEVKEIENLFKYVLIQDGIDSEYCAEISMSILREPSAYRLSTDVDGPQYDDTQII